MEKDINHGSASAFAHTSTSLPTLRRSFQNRNLASALAPIDPSRSDQPSPPPSSPTKKPPDASSSTTAAAKTHPFSKALDIHNTPELSVVLVEGKICIDVQFEFWGKELLDARLMVEKQAFLQSEIKARALEVLEEAIRGEDAKIGGKI
jgi:hypothetical protein